jgi:cysteine desulfurase/selenocysteine lyase
MADGSPVTLFDPYAARAQFPILSREIDGQPLVYLDSANTSQKPRAVIDAMSRFMEQSYAPINRSAYRLAAEATDAYEGARAAVRRFVNAPKVHELIFTKNATEALNLVAACWGRANLQRGDVVVLTHMEHHANIVPWHMLVQEKGIVLRWVPLTADGQLDLATLPALLRGAKAFAFTAMSNVLGTITPVRQLCDAAHAAGAIAIVDACQYVPHNVTDVQAWDADFVAFSGHKLYGPTGIGVLWGRPERLAALPPWQGGGEMIDRVDFDHITYADPPLRFEAGTPSIIEAIGLGAAVKWLERLDRPAISAHEHALYEAAAAGLSGIRGARILGTTQDKGAILSFTLEGAHAHDVAQLLDRYGVAVRAGAHCAEPLMRRLGVSSSLRASFALYNTRQEVDAFLDALDRTRTFFT